jgi:RNA polymerase sigma factor (sigma-70 family)
VERMNEDVTAAVRPIAFEQLRAFYTAEYPKLIKILMFLDATIEEAEDAAQKAMADFVRRSEAMKPPDHPVTYVQRAAIHFFIKERQRERERLPRELRGGHLVTGIHFDDQLTNWEDEQYISQILDNLTSTQRQVIKLVMDGLSTREIAEELGKSDETIRQHLKNGRDRLKRHPQIAAQVNGRLQEQGSVSHGVRSTVTTPESRKEEVQ